MTEHILRTLLDIAISSSLLIAALLLLRRIFRRRISPRLQYAAWAFVLIRLLIPFSLPSPISIMNLFEPYLPEPVSMHMKQAVFPSAVSAGNIKNPQTSANPDISAAIDPANNMSTPVTTMGNGVFPRISALWEKACRKRRRPDPCRNYASQEL